MDPRPTLARPLLTALVFLIAALAFAYPARASAVSAQQVLAEETTPTVITLVATGDLMAHMPQVNYAHTSTGYNFYPAFYPAKSVLGNASITVGNLETTLRDYGYSGYPTFRTPVAYANALKSVGFDALATANNHSLDGGSYGVRYTTNYLYKIGLKRFGTNNVGPAYVSRSGVRVGFLAYTYGTNGIPSPFAGAVNRISLSKIRSDIRYLKPKVDFVVVYLHFGNEYVATPESSTKATARAAIDAGADIVMGSHPHVVRKVEYYKGKYIVYSMGNYISAMSKYLTDLGIITKVWIRKQDGVTKVLRMRVLPVYRDRTSGAGARTYRTVLIDRELANPDSLISSYDKTRMREYRAYVKRMYPYNYFY